MGSATLQVTRRLGGVVSQGQPFEVWLDGARVGEVRIHETTDVPLAAGSHTLQMRAGRNLSPERTFEVGDDQTVRFWCRGAVILAIYLASFLKPTLAITLRRA